MFQSMNEEQPVTHPPSGEATIPGTHLRTLSWLQTAHKTLRLHWFLNFSLPPIGMYEAARQWETFANPFVVGRRNIKMQSVLKSPISKLKICYMLFSRHYVNVSHPKENFQRCFNTVASGSG